MSLSSSIVERTLDISSTHHDSEATWCGVRSPRYDVPEPI